MSEVFPKSPKLRIFDDIARGRGTVFRDENGVIGEVFEKSCVALSDRRYHRIYHIHILACATDVCNDAARRFCLFARLFVKRRRFATFVRIYTFICPARENFREEDMEVKFAEYADAVVVRLIGELDEHTASQVRPTIDMAIDMCRQRTFIFDFSKLDFMDSTGIGMLLGRYKKLKQRGIEAKICGPNRLVDKILNTAGIYSIIKKTS